MENSIPGPEDNARRFFEAQIGATLKGQSLQISWDAGESPDEGHLLRIARVGGKPLRLKVSQDALEEGEDAANRPRLAQRIEQELQVSESGSVGYVKAIH